MIKVIAFDYRGVVSAFGPIKRWLDENLSEEDERYILYNLGATKWDKGEMNLDQMYDALSKITGVPAEKMWETFFEKQLLNDDVVNLIRELKNNYKIYLFSNHQGELLRKLLQMHGITELFDDIIVSSEHKLIKPSNEFFNILLKVARVKRDEIIFIDDSAKNVEAAREFGIKSILFKDTEGLKKSLKSFAIIV